jgi:hypothetical protein
MKHSQWHEWQKVEGWAAAVRHIELLHPHAEPEALAELGSFLAGLVEAMREGQTIHVGPRVRPHPSADLPPLDFFEPGGR